MKNNNDLFIYFERKIYKLFVDNDGITRLKLKEPTEITTNKTCLLLHHNKNIKKSGYLVFDKSEELDEEFIYTDATKRLGMIDSTMIHLLKTETENELIYYYISKLEIERLFVEYEFSNIYPLDFFLYNSNPNNELYGLLSKDIFFMKQFNNYKDLENTSRTVYQSDIISFQDNLNYLISSKAKNIIYDGSIEELIEIHDNINKTEVNNYIPYNNRSREEKKEIIDPTPLVTNLSLISLSSINSQLTNKKYVDFCFIDKISTFYKAKKVKPFLWILSLFFLITSIFFTYQFLNTKAINYIYNDKNSKLNFEIKKYNNKNQNALSKNYIQYYSPLNIHLLKETMNLMKTLDVKNIMSYTLFLDKETINIVLESKTIKNVEIMNKIKDNYPKLFNVTYISKKNKGYEISFSYGKKNNKHRRIKR